MAALRQRIDAFCSDISTHEMSSQALNSIVSELESGTLTLTQLVENSGEQLTSTNDTVRNLGTRLLAEIMSKSTVVASLTAQQTQTLLSFFAERMKDEACVREVLRGSEALIEACGKTILSNDDCRKAASTLLNSMLQDVHVQALSLSDRGRAFGIVDKIAFHLGMDVLGDAFVDGFTHCMDGERDPRNLRMCFAIVPKIAASGLLKENDQKRTEALFGVFSCYFPITFTPPPNDTVGITTEMLKEDMMASLTCTPLFAPLVIDLALSKLASSEVESARTDAMDLIASLATKFGARVGMADCGRRVWSALRLQMVEGGSEDVVLRARSCLRHVLRKAGEQEELEGKPGVAKEMLSAIKMQCLVELRTPEDPRCRKSTVALQCGVTSHPLVAEELLPVVIPQLCTTYVEGSNLSDVRRQTFLHILLEIMMSAKALAESEYMKPGAPHPLSPYVEQIYSVACTSVLHPIGGEDEEEEGSQGPGLEIMCELTCQGLLDAKACLEAAMHVTNMLVAGGKSAARCQRIAMRFAQGEKTRPLAIDVVLPALLREASRSEGAQPHHYSALGTLCVTDVGVLKLAVPHMWDIIKAHQPLPCSALLLRCLVDVAEDASEHAAQISAYLLETVVPHLVDPLIQDIRNGASPDLWLVEAAGELVGHVLRQTAGTEAHKAYATGLLNALGSETGVLMMFVCAVLCNCDSSVSVPTGEMLTLMLPLVLEELGALEQGKRAWRTEALCSLVNKMGGSQEVQTKLDEWMQGSVVASARAGDVAAVRLVGWLAKACLMRGHAAGTTLMQVLYDMLGGEYASAASAAYEIVVKDTATALCLSCHATERPLWKQKLFHSQLQRLSSGYVSAPNSNKGPYLAALANLLSHVPRGAITVELPSVLPLLVQALKCEEVSVKEASLSLLSAFTQVKHDHAHDHAHGEACEVDQTAMLLQGQVSSLIPALLECSRLKGSLKVRCLAVDCLSYLPALLSYQSLFPYKKQVTVDLGTVLLDHKRCVRSRAAHCRNLWFMLTA